MMRGKGSRGRQWGADRQVNPMPAVPRLAPEWTMMLGRAAVVVTVGAWLALVITVIHSQLLTGGPGRASLLQTILFLVVVTMLAASASAYLVGRLGFYYRARRHRRVPRALLDEAFAQTPSPSLTALVPSYQEEPGVIRMTLLSAALQEYPEMRVVLLIDDPPEPRHAEPYRLLEAARGLPGEIHALLAEPRGRFDLALARYEETHDVDRPLSASRSSRWPSTTSTRATGSAGWSTATGQPTTTSSSSPRTCSASSAPTSRSRAPLCAAPPRTTRPRCRPNAWPSSTAAWPGRSAASCPTLSASATCRCRARPTRR